MTTQPVSAAPRPADVATRALLAGLAELLGIPVTDFETLEGFELARESIAARVGPDPLNDSRLRLFLEVAPLDLRDPKVSAPFLLELHRFNAGSRPEGRWTATIEDDDRLCLSGSFEVAGLDPQSLHALLFEAFDLAQELHLASQS